MQLLTRLIKQTSLLLFIIIFIGCNKEIKRFIVYNNLKLPSSKAEIERTIDSLKAKDKAGKLQIKNFGATHAFIGYSSSKPYFVAFFAKNKANVVTAYKLFFVDPIDDIQNTENETYNYNNLNKLFHIYANPTTSVISYSLVSSIIEELNSKYGQSKEVKGVEQVYLKWKGGNVDIQTVTHNWQKEGLLIHFSIKTEPFLNNIQIMLEYELSPDYLKENENLIDKLNAKETVF